MYAKFIQALPWSIRLGTKFFQIHPLGSIFAVVLALLGQIAAIGAFMLPIKIVMLMGGDGIPGALPPFIQNFDKKVVISIFAGFSVASYLFYQLSIKVIEAISLSGIRIVEKRNQKLNLFEGQRELTLKAYTKYIDAVASCSFVLLGTALLFMLYAEIAITFLLYVFLCALVAYFVLKKTKVSSDIDMIMLQKKLPTLIGAGFFLIFSWILVDYIFLSIPNNFLVLLLSIILGRQLLSQFAVAVNSFIFLNNNKQKLKAVLVHGEVLQPVMKKADTFWEFLDSDSFIHEQLHHALRSLCVAFETGVRIEWKDSELPGVALLSARSEYHNCRVLVKIFDRNKSSEALHEAALLLEETEDLPSPKLISTQLISGHHLHFFCFKNCSFLEKAPSVFEKNEMSLHISNSKLPIELKTRYKRSHRMLWDRIENSLIKKLMVAFSERVPFQVFLLRFDQLKIGLKNQALCLHNPHVGNASLWAVSDDGCYLILHWGKWSLEPYGAGIGPVYLNSTKYNETASDYMPPSLQDAEEFDAMIISSLSFQLVKQTDAQQLIKAKETYKTLVALLENTRFGLN